MLMPLAGSRNICRCLSSAFGSFWRAAKRNSPASAKRGAKLKLILISSARDRALRRNRLDRLKRQNHKIKGDFATRASPAFWRGTFDNHLKSTQKGFFKQAAGSGAFRTGPWRRIRKVPQITDCGCQSDLIGSR
jgi:hypothetical protein